VRIRSGLRDKFFQSKNKIFFPHIPVAVMIDQMHKTADTMNTVCTGQKTGGQIIETI